MTEPKMHFYLHIEKSNRAQKIKRRDFAIEETDPKCWSPNTASSEENEMGLILVQYLEVRHIDGADTHWSVLTSSGGNKESLEREEHCYLWSFPKG